jgi:hypothetical protein
VIKFTRFPWGGGAPHAFLLDTGSVGILTPRSVLGPGFQQFDPSQDIEFQYVSSKRASSEVTAP